MTANHPGEIELIVDGKRFPVKFWDTRSSLEEFAEGTVEQKGYIEVGEWLTDSQLSDLEAKMIPKVQFKVVISYNDSSFCHIGAFLRSEKISGGYRYHYAVMLGSNILQI